MKARKDQAIHKALRQIPYGLHVIGVRGKGEAMNAFVAAWVCQCSFDPPLVMVAIRKGTRSHELVKSGRVFSVNLVDRKDRDIIDAAADRLNREAMDSLDYQAER